MGDYLRPRFKVIADYPNAFAVVGSVWDEEEAAHYIMHHEELDAKKYPHLFKKLEWWEEREPDEEMPKYLKTPAGNSVREVESINPQWGTVVFVGGKVRKIKQWLPATEEEYNQYITTNGLQLNNHK